MVEGKNEPNDLANQRHLKWLVKSRSANQTSALHLLDLIETHYEALDLNKAAGNVASELIAINFSLWRAVFLSDVNDGVAFVLRDAKSFLKNLVLSNAVAFPQDRGAKEWTFTYYMRNAQYRLEKLAKNQPDILPRGEFLNTKNPDDKNWWAECQQSLDNCIRNFEKKLQIKSKTRLN